MTAPAAFYETVNLQFVKSEMKKMNTLKHLFSPITIKGMEVPNRAVMPPMGTSLGKDNTVSGAKLSSMCWNVF